MKNIYVSFLAMILLTACEREFRSDVRQASNPGTTTTSDAVKLKPITADLQGNIYDENDQPAVGVNIKIGAKTATTNSEGYFRIEDAALDKSGSFITAEKAGYFRAYRSFCANTGTNQVSIKLLKKTSPGSINAATGGEVSLANGSKIALPVNAVVNASSGIAYTGAINVYATYIDPTKQDIAETVPGSFTADDKDGNRVSLVSYGMMAVELESAAGEKLQIAPGKSAKLTTAIPASLQASADASIPLWYVDEKTGIWKEEGSATKSGNSYVGEVKHFTFWNCDKSVNAIFLSTTFKNKEGLPLANTRVEIRSMGANPVKGHVWTDSLGQISEYVPMNALLEFSILDPCHLPVFTKTVGPFAKDVTLEPIYAETTNASIITIKGKITSCSGKGMLNAYAVISMDHMIRYAAADAKGNFNISFTQCAGSDHTAKIFGVDASTTQFGRAVTVKTTTVTDAGTLYACDSSLQQYIRYTLDGKKYIIVDSLDAYSLVDSGATKISTNYIFGKPVGSAEHLRFYFQGVSVGSYELKGFALANYSMGYDHAQVNVTNFPNKPGEFFEGSFAVHFYLTNISGMVGHDMDVTFRLRRRE